MCQSSGSIANEEFLDIYICFKQEFCIRVFRMRIPMLIRYSGMALLHWINLII